MIQLLHSDPANITAPFGPLGTPLPCKIHQIKVITAKSDPLIPLVIREATVGLTVRTIFEKTHLPPDIAASIPDGSLIAYQADVAERIEIQNRRRKEARDLFNIGFLNPKNKIGNYEIFVFPPGSFELQDEPPEDD